MEKQQVWQLVWRQRLTNGTGKRQSSKQRGRSTCLSQVATVQKRIKTGWLFPKTQKGSNKMNRESVITAQLTDDISTRCRSNQIIQAREVFGTEPAWLDWCLLMESRKGPSQIGTTAIWRAKTLRIHEEQDTSCSQQRCYSVKKVLPELEAADDDANCVCRRANSLFKEQKFCTSYRLGKQIPTWIK